MVDTELDTNAGIIGGNSVLQNELERLQNLVSILTQTIANNNTLIKNLSAQLSTSLSPALSTPTIDRQSLPAQSFAPPPALSTHGESYSRNPRALTQNFLQRLSTECETTSAAFAPSVPYRQSLLIGEVVLN